MPKHQRPFVLITCLLFASLSAASSFNSADAPRESSALRQQLPFAEADFYMAFMSDPQYPWSCRTQGENCDDRNRAWQDNINQIDSLNALQDSLGKEHLAGLVINGDLTAFGHDWQLDAFRELYHKRLRMTVYPGLGNHDIANNVDDCFENGCATGMMQYLKSQVDALNVRNFDYADSGTYYQFPSLKRRHSKSFAYSWDVGDVHFVQLNNYPTYTASWNGWIFSKARREYYQIESARQWLIEDLEQATLEGKHIILNYHISAFTDEITDILQQYKVSAIFAGHLHQYIGQVDFHTLWNFYGVGQHLPVFLGGAAVFQKYLLVRFMADQFEVSLVSSEPGGNYSLEKEGVYPLYRPMPE